VVETGRYQWLSHRSYKLNEITILFFHLDNIMTIIEEGISTLQPLSSSINNYEFQYSLSVRRLIECNSQKIELLNIDLCTGMDDFEDKLGLLVSDYFKQNFQAVKEVSMETCSAEFVRMIMDSLPNLGKMAERGRTASPKS
jgi:hypothetical protein